MAKKVGIVTHYYQSRNYGGVLQAYALCYKIKKIVPAIQVEQICVPITVPQKISFWKKVFQRAVNIIKYLTTGIFTNSKKKREEKTHNVSERSKQAFETFTKNIIPHSEKYYDLQTIKECVNDYDIFITGSDQVWNFNWYNPIFFLDFVPNDKTKFSYAASFSMKKLNREQKRIIVCSLKDYKAISVRETKALDLLHGLTNIEPEVVLDPTLLLTETEWADLCEERLIREKYVFCYFLSNDKKEREIVKQFAQSHQLKIAAIPHVGGAVRVHDIGFGDISFFEATPQQFLSLIKHAEYVFTNSFHAVAFSLLYKKQFFAHNSTALTKQHKHCLVFLVKYGANHLHLNHIILSMRVL